MFKKIPIFFVFFIIGCVGALDSTSDIDNSTRDYLNKRINRFNVTVNDNFPHKADFIYPTNSDENTMVIVALHGGGGTKHDFSYFLGLKNNSNEEYNFENSSSLFQYLTAHNTAIVFVQGQSIPEKPNAFTWNNTVMNSGQDDKEFLIQLSDYLRNEEGFSKVMLMGHSMGGVMTNRVWCEAPESFDAFGSSAGPMSVDLFNSCNPVVYKPYIHVTGLNDRILQIVEEQAITGNLIDHSEDEFLTLDPVVRVSGGEAFVHSVPEFKNEITSYSERVNRFCSELENSYSYFPNLSNWDRREKVNCNGKLKIVELKDRDHCTASGGTDGDYKCDVSLTTLGTTDHLDRFMQFFKKFHNDTPLNGQSLSFPPDGDSLVQMVDQGQNRKALIYKTEQVNNQKKLSVLMVLHGGGGNITKSRENTDGRFEKLADSLGEFILVYPEGVLEEGSSDEAHWNDGRNLQQYKSHALNINDSAFLDRLADKLSEDYSGLNRNQVYLVGASNGGMMVQRAYCDASTQFSGFGSVMAALPSNISGNCNPSLKKPLVIINGTDDPIMQYNSEFVHLLDGSPDLGGGLTVPDTLSFWTSQNSCQYDQNLDLPNSNLTDSSDVTKFDYVCAEADFSFYSVNGGGHTWPNGKSLGPVAESLLGYTNRDVDAASLIWMFFKSP